MLCQQVWLIGQCSSRQWGHVKIGNQQAGYTAPATQLQHRSTLSPRSIPVLDQPIPASSGNFAALQGMPLCVYADAIMGLDGPEALRRLPVPEPAAALAISRDDIPAIRRKIGPACIASNGVTLEGLLAILSESVLGAATQNRNKLLVQTQSIKHLPRCASSRSLLATRENAQSSSQPGAVNPQTNAAHATRVFKGTTEQGPQPRQR